MRLRRGPFRMGASIARPGRLVTLGSCLALLASLVVLVGISSVASADDVTPAPAGSAT